MTQDVGISRHLEDLDKVLAEGVDSRIVSREDIRAWYCFVVYLVNLAEADGWVYDGHSFKVGAPMSVLVVRGTIDGVAHVVFSSGRSTTDCIRAFLRKMEEGWLEWRVDQFR